MYTHLSVPQRIRMSVFLGQSLCARRARSIRDVHIRRLRPRTIPEKIPTPMRAKDICAGGVRSKNPTDLVRRRCMHGSCAQIKQLHILRCSGLRDCSTMCVAGCMCTAAKQGDFSGGGGYVRWRVGRILGVSMKPLLLAFERQFLYISLLPWNWGGGGGVRYSIHRRMLVETRLKT